MTKPSPSFIKKRLVGALEVRAAKDTERGNSGEFIKKGSIGYVTASRDGMYIVFWMCITHDSVHPSGDVESTGARYTNWDDAKARR